MALPATGQGNVSQILENDDTTTGNVLDGDTTQRPVSHLRVLPAAVALAGRIHDGQKHEELFGQPATPHKRGP